MTNQTGPQSFDALAVGRSTSDPFVTYFSIRDPTSNDVNFPIQKRWYNTVLNNEWILVSYSSFAGTLSANWETISHTSIGVDFLTGNSGGPVGVDGSNNINVIGDTTTINIVGNPATHTLTASTTGSVATSYVTDSGTAIPALGILNVNGASGITTSGATNHVTVTLTTPVSIAHGGTNATSMATTDGTVYFDGTRLVTTATGTSGQVLTSNGVGVAPTYQTNAALLTVVIQTFTTTGTYTPTTGMLYCTIEVVGGGGGGGGGEAIGSAHNIVLGGGGGGGGYARKTVSSAIIGASKSVTVGAAGTAGAAGNNAGGSGGTSSVGSIISATGGTGGSGSAPTVDSKSTSGAPGGIGLNGDINISGTYGSGCFAIDTTSSASGFQSAGGSSFYGAGGLGSSFGSAASGTSGNDGLLYGGGGSGAGGSSGSGTTTATAGGAGAKGIVIITEFI